MDNEFMLWTKPFARFSKNEKGGKRYGLCPFYLHGFMWLATPTPPVSYGLEIGDISKWGTTVNLPMLTLGSELEFGEKKTSLNVPYLNVL